jgi:small GTP-binding protein
MTAYRKLTRKLILVGSSGVGKTSLVSAYFKHSFESQTTSTVAPAFCTASVEIDPHTTVDLQLWDTAGQEQYQSISEMFYRESHIAFVCYDRPAVSSVEKWAGRVREHAPGARIFVVATKSDLLPDRQAEEAVAQEGGEIAARIGGKHWITSALEGTNVAALFEAAARDSAELQCPTGGEKAAPRRERTEEEKCC